MKAFTRLFGRQPGPREPATHETTPAEPQPPEPLFSPAQSSGPKLPPVSPADAMMQPALPEGLREAPPPPDPASFDPPAIAAEPVAAETIQAAAPGATPASGTDRPIAPIMAETAAPAAVAPPPAAAAPPPAAAAPLVAGAAPRGAAVDWKVIELPKPGPKPSPAPKGAAGAAKTSAAKKRPSRRKLRLTGDALDLVASPLAAGMMAASPRHYATSDAMAVLEQVRGVMQSRGKPRSRRPDAAPEARPRS